MTYTPSKRAVWRAVNNWDHGQRLVEIAKEHVKLAKLAIESADTTDRAIIYGRIEVLRQEREEILRLYEDVNDDG